MGERGRGGGAGQGRAGRGRHPPYLLSPPFARSMLSYMEGSSVTKNASEKKINSLSDFMAQATDADVLQVTLSSHFPHFPLMYLALFKHFVPRRPSTRPR